MYNTEAPRTEKNEEWRVKNEESYRIRKKKKMKNEEWRMKNEEWRTKNPIVCTLGLFELSSHQFHSLHSSFFTLHFSIITRSLNNVKKESTTKSFVLRIDADTMNAIEAWAADEFRSTNGQLQWIIAEALRKSGRLKKKKKTENNEDQK